MEVRVFDARGMKCPLPTLKRLTISREMKPGEILEVVADCPTLKMRWQVLCRHEQGASVCESRRNHEKSSGSHVDSSLEDASALSEIARSPALATQFCGRGLSQEPACDWWLRSRPQITWTNGHWLIWLAHSVWTFRCPLAFPCRLAWNQSRSPDRRHFFAAVCELRCSLLFVRRDPPQEE